MSKKSLPYEGATAGEAALVQLQKALAKFGCMTFGTGFDVERGVTIVQFKWRTRNVQLEASWKGYAQAWLNVHPYKWNSRCTRDQHEQRALDQAKISVCSILRDWVSGQIAAVECGIMSFEAAFMPHMLLENGQRVIDRVQTEMLPMLENHNDR